LSAQRALPGLPRIALRARHHRDCAGCRDEAATADAPDVNDTAGLGVWRWLHPCYCSAARRRRRGSSREHGVPGGCSTRYRRTGGSIYAGCRRTGTRPLVDHAHAMAGRNGVARNRGSRSCARRSGRGRSLRGAWSTV